MAVKPELDQATGQKKIFDLFDAVRIPSPRAMVMAPRLLILDETLSSLDQLEQARLLELFDELQSKHKFTYIFISHDLALVRKACTRIAVMYLGRVVELAENRELFFKPRHPCTRAMLAALPTLEDNRYDAATCLLDGEPPSPVHIPQGCSFKTRCPDAIDACTAQLPPLCKAGSTLVECHLFAQKEALQQAGWLIGA